MIEWLRHLDANDQATGAKLCLCLFAVLVLIGLVLFFATLLGATP